ATSRQARGSGVFFRMEEETVLNLLISFLSLYKSDFSELNEDLQDKNGNKNSAQITSVTNSNSF
ncbi:MAG: hypothetical protein RSB23_07180, partial [Alistipes sp.]